MCVYTILGTENSISGSYLLAKVQLKTLEMNRSMARRGAGCSEEKHRGTEMMVRIDFVFDCLTV